MNRVKELRVEKGIKQADLAQQLGVSQATLSNWERGVHDPANETLTRLAQTFGCSVDYLLGTTTIKYPVDEKGMVVDQVYYRIAQEAKEAGVDPHDLQMALDFLKRAKERDEEKRRG
ncbi:MAG: helix-turn-helix domain-containing protein [Defluviitaleaceae bacterium]|nr:helix-turn-helix domain-containing protein [Defluviitaleaceae bacterium]